MWLNCKKKTVSFFLVEWAFFFENFQNCAFFFWTFPGGFRVSSCVFPNGTLMDIRWQSSMYGGHEMVELWNLPNVVSCWVCLKCWLNGGLWQKNWLLWDMWMVPNSQTWTNHLLASLGVVDVGFTGISFTTVPYSQGSRSTKPVSYPLRPSHRWVHHWRELQPWRAAVKRHTSGKGEFRKPKCMQV